MSKVPSGFNRATLLRRTPPNAVNCPASNTEPSGCSRTSYTEPSTAAPGLKLGSSKPFAVTRATERRLTPSYVLNEPPNKTAPFGCTAIANTTPSTPDTGRNAKSTEPFPFNRTMPLKLVPLNVENEPPTKICCGAPPTDGSNATASTDEFGPSPPSNVRSTAPFAFNRATCRRVSPPTVAKSPTTTTLPSACNASALTAPSSPEPGSKVRSSVPFALSRATPARGTPLIAANEPPITMRPSG